MAPKTWQEAAAAAGIVTMVREDKVVVNPSTKKKTPLEYRMQQPQIKESEKPLSMAEKTLLKKASLQSNLVCTKDSPNME